MRFISPSFDTAFCTVQASRTSIPQSLVLWHAQVLKLRGFYYHFYCITLPRNSAELSARSILHLWHMPLFKIYKKRERERERERECDIIRTFQPKVSRSISDLDRNIFSVWQAWQGNFVDNVKYFQKIKIHHTHLKFAEVSRSVHQFLQFLFLFLQLSMEIVSVWGAVIWYSVDISSYLFLCYIFWLRLI